MTVCKICGKRTIKPKYPLCLNCWRKQKFNSIQKPNIEPYTPTNLHESTLKINSQKSDLHNILVKLFKWAFSSSDITKYNYRGQTMRVRTFKILEPFYVLMMFIAILPVIILMAPFWIYAKLTNKIK